MNASEASKARARSSSVSVTLSNNTLIAIPTIPPKPEIIGRERGDVSLSEVKTERTNRHMYVVEKKNGVCTVHD